MALTLVGTTGELQNATVDGTNKIGFFEIPQNSQSSAYTLALTDSGKHILKSGSTAFTVTIPANGSIAFPIGSTVSFVNTGANNLTIAITTDTLYLAGTGSTGSRTLAQWGSATALKITSTSWIISGSGLT